MIDGLSRFCCPSCLVQGFKPRNDHVHNLGKIHTLSLPFSAWTDSMPLVPCQARSQAEQKEPQAEASRAKCWGESEGCCESSQSNTGTSNQA